MGPRIQTRLAVVVIACLSATLGLSGPILAQETARDVGLAPLLYMDAKDVLKDTYIVVIKTSDNPDHTAQSRNLAKLDPRRREQAARDRDAVKDLAVRSGGRILSTYDKVLIGFSVRIAKDKLRALQAHPAVARISAARQVSPQGVQTNPPTGLDRIDARLIPLNGRFEYAQTGKGVTVYVIDTGVRASHSDFGGRATATIDVTLEGNGPADCHGHGTHVAGIAAGSTYGVAKESAIFSVKALNCDIVLTPWNIIIDGVEWVAVNGVKPSVVNFSIGGGAFLDVDIAIENLVAAGFFTTVSAMNNDVDACNISPARTPGAVTVGNTRAIIDERHVGTNSSGGTTSSNWGACLDLFAPGRAILSSSNQNDTATAFRTGTSMSAPHVAGVAALFLENNIAATPAGILAAIHAANTVTGTVGPGGVAWPGIVDAKPGSPNELLHWGPIRNGASDGDPHMTTVDGVSYDFQAAGEFVLARHGASLEIQTRQVPFVTNNRKILDPVTNIESCASVTTAIAGKTGTTRFSLQSAVVTGSVFPELKVDGAVVNPGAVGMHLADGTHISREAGAYEFRFPDGTIMIANWTAWPSGQKAVFSTALLNTRADEGLLGSSPAGDWLPRKADASPMGPMPAAIADRASALYDTFADSWRVTAAGSLFDYKSGESTATFDDRSWPRKTGRCRLDSKTGPTAPPDTVLAATKCAAILDPTAKQRCIADVSVTNSGFFGGLYAEAELRRNNATRVAVFPDTYTVKLGDSLDLTAQAQFATGARMKNNVKPDGRIRFWMDGVAISALIPVDSRGAAALSVSGMALGPHKIWARFHRNGTAQNGSDSVAITVNVVN